MAAQESSQSVKQTKGGKMPKCQLDGNFFVLQEPKLIHGRVLAVCGESDENIYNCLTANNNFSVIMVTDMSEDLRRISILSSNRFIPKEKINQLQTGSAITLGGNQLIVAMPKKTKFVGNFFRLEEVKLIHEKLVRVATNPCGDIYDDLLNNNFSIILTENELFQSTTIISYNGKIAKENICRLKIDSRITFCADQLIGETYS
jgi:hypothetical protein